MHGWEWDLILCKQETERESLDQRVNRDGEEQKVKAHAVTSGADLS